MRIALVFPPFYHPSMYNLPPLGLINLGTALNAGRHDAEIVDLVLALRRGELTAGSTLYDECARMILAREPDMVALAAQCATYPPLIGIAKRLRLLRPDLKIIVGGHNATFLAEETLERFPFIDAIVRGEAEVTLQKLATDMAAGGDGRGVEGVTSRSNGQIVINPERELIADLDSLPLPDYTLTPPLEAYRAACDLPRSIAILEIGRGCPHNCVYCSESAMWRRRTRTFSVERLMREMLTLRDSHGAECFLLAYDQFTADRSFAEAFCKGVIDEGLNTLPWYCISRLDTVDAGLLALMMEAGCESMCYGIDSGSKRTLAFIRKRIDDSILFRRVRETTEQGLVPTLSFVIGFPEEERSDIDATLELALMTGVQGNSNPLIQMPTVLPGTELHRTYAEKLVREVDTYFALGIEFSDGSRLMEDEALIQSDPFLFSSFYNLPNPNMELTELDRLAAHFPLAAKLYPTSFLLLGRATEQSVSQLFGDFLDWVDQAEDRAPGTLSAADCYRHFSSFAGHRLDGLQTGWPHLPSVISYETKALEAGKFANIAQVGNMDIDRLDQWRPQRNRDVLVAAFAYDMPTILDDLKSGCIHEIYPPHQVWLVFRQQDEMLDITEINDFGRDLLEMCDGTHPIEDVAERLYSDYGQEMTPAAFAESCREAAAELESMNLLYPSQRSHA